MSDFDFAAGDAGATPVSGAQSSTPSDRPHLWNVPSWRDPELWTAADARAGSLLEVPGNRFAQLSIAPDSQIDAVTVRPANGETFVISPGNPLPAGRWEGPVVIGASYGEKMIDTGNVAPHPRNWSRLHTRVTTTFINAYDTKPCVANPRALLLKGGGNFADGPYLALRVHYVPILDAAITRCAESLAFNVNVPGNTSAQEGIILAIPMMGRSVASVLVGTSLSALALNYRAWLYKFNAGDLSHPWLRAQVYPAGGGTQLVAANSVDTFTQTGDYADYLVLTGWGGATPNSVSVMYETRD